MEKKISLNKFQHDTLYFLVQTYAINKKGNHSVELIKGKKHLLQLRKMDLCFKTTNGWFPSTKGQEYINFSGKNNL